MNIVTLIGNLATGVELKELGEGQEVWRRSSLAVDRLGATGESTSSASPSGTGRLRCAPQYLPKGARIGVDGRLRSRSWDDPEGNRRSVVEVVANHVEFLGRAASAAATSDQEAPLACRTPT